MDSHKIISIPTLSGEVLEVLPESIRSYIRYLEGTIQQLQARVHELGSSIPKIVLIAANHQVVMGLSENQKA